MVENYAAESIVLITHFIKGYPSFFILMRISDGVERGKECEGVWRVVSED